MGKEFAASKCCFTANNRLSADFTIEFRGDYIYFRHDSNYEITPGNSAKLWSALADACRSCDCLFVLSEGIIASREMSMKNAFALGIQAAEAIPGLQLACCFESYIPDITTNFLKLIALHRGAEIEFFSDRTEALQWLRGEGKLTEAASK